MIKRERIQALRADPGPIVHITKDFLEELLDERQALRDVLPGCLPLGPGGEEAYDEALALGEDEDE
jgi:hypothetical protein